MNILIASTFLPPDVVGGAERIALDLATQIQKSENVKLLSTTAHENTIRLRYFKGLTLIYSTLGKSTIRKILEKEKIDIVHSHIVLPWGYVFKNFNVKKVITCHGDDIYKKRNFLVEIFTRQALEKADVVVSPSKWLADIITKKYNIIPRIIPNGIDTSLFRPSKQKDKNIILFVGRFIDIKGIELITKVAAVLRDYEFWFVGNGPLKKLINLSNTKNLGKKNREELSLIYQRASICLFPSKVENFPLVGLEAMASGCIVLATSTGFSEYLEDMKNGIIVKYDENDVINKIKLLEKDESLRKQIQINARKTALKFDNKNMIKEYYDLYKELAKNGNKDY